MDQLIPPRGTSEIDAIAAQSTKKWIDEGGPSLEIEKIKRREEFHIISSRQGVLRTLHHNLGLPHSAFFTRGLAFALSPLLPATVFGHMILAVASKPAESETA
jgi:hypothetical protein